MAGALLVLGINAARFAGGVRHGSPAVALHVGHVRARYPRATCSPVGGLVSR